jgi:hypothetical protein
MCVLAKWEDWPKNIILPEVASYIAAASQSQRTLGHNFPLHKYLHHGLSSQAMLFNLVGPLFLSDDFTPIRNIIGKRGVMWPDDRSRLIFEYEDRNIFNEDSGQPTSIDLVVLDANDCPKIFIESKFVEKEFGGCSVLRAGDCEGRNPMGDVSMCYLHHIGRKYWSLMQKFGIDTGSIGKDSICILANYYQFFREIVFAFEHQGVFLLLCDERSPVFYSNGPKGPRGVMPFLISLLPDQLKKHVSYITLQEVVAEIESLSDYKWIVEFKSKYGLTTV